MERVFSFIYLHIYWVAPVAFVSLHPRSALLVPERARTRSAPRLEIQGGCLVSDLCPRL